MNTTTNFRTKRMVQLALFIAIILLMTFTPIGYIRTFGLEISLIVIPVTVGAIILGPTSGAILGAVFGITSFFQCFGMSPFGAALLGISPIGTFILCMFPRILMGWLTGLIFQTVKKLNKNLAYPVASIAGPLLNTALFMSTLVLIFYKTEYIQGFVKSTGAKNVVAFIIAFVGINGLVEAIVGFVLGTAIAASLDIFFKKSGIR